MRTGGGAFVEVVATLGGPATFLPGATTRCTTCAHVQVADARHG